jgi:hypothetical protein
MDTTNEGGVLLGAIAVAGCVPQSVTPNPERYWPGLGTRTRAKVSSTSGMIGPTYTKPASARMARPRGTAGKRRTAIVRSVMQIALLLSECPRTTMRARSLIWLLLSRPPHRWSFRGGLHARFRFAGHDDHTLWLSIHAAQQRGTRQNLQQSGKSATGTLLRRMPKTVSFVGAPIAKDLPTESAQLI